MTGNNKEDRQYAHGLNGGGAPKALGQRLGCAFGRVLG
jgi:hypothetical protein